MNKPLSYKMHLLRDCCLDPALRYFRNLFILGFLLIIQMSVYAQPVKTQYTGWLALFHKQQLSEKISFIMDAQYRLDRQFSKTSGYLMRPGLSMDLSENHSAALGYAFLGSYDEQDGKRGFYAENRVWEQLQFEREIVNATLTSRLRLEQRFINNEDGGYSQRLRYYIRHQFPLTHSPAKFVRGPYMVFQNEVFLTVQHKERAGGSFFDQNRAYFSIGQRFSKKIDAELGYQFRYQKETNSNLREHIVQLAVYTDL